MTMKLRTLRPHQDEWVEHDLTDGFTQWAFGKAITAFEDLNVEQMILRYTTRDGTLMWCEITEEPPPDDEMSDAQIEANYLAAIDPNNDPERDA